MASQRPQSKGALRVQQSITETRLGQHAELISGLHAHDADNDEDGGDDNEEGDRYRQQLRHQHARRFNESSRDVGDFELQQPLMAEIDERISIHGEERAFLWHRLVVVLFYIACWYTFSIGLTFYNKWLFKDYGLDTPLFVTSSHAILISVMSWAHRLYRQRVLKMQLTSVSFQDWFYCLSPAGITSALDIGFSNMSLNMINITLYTMVKSTVVVWLLLAAFIFGLEKPSRPLIIVILMISGGLVLFRLKEGITFHSIGLFLVLAASIMGGLRWVLTQLVLHKEKERLGLKHPIDTMAYVMPCVALALFPFAMYFEGKEIADTHLLSGQHLLPTVWWLVFGALLAFFLTLSEFLLVSSTSGLALSVAGIFKEICTIIVAVTFTPDNRLTTLNIFGLAVSIAGIAYYNLIKYRQEQQRIKSNVVAAHQHGH
eukprot:m.27170 g.27170  ORF g.27170 m.27170 type:complete len:430 (-) comp10181_c0_seq1:46-1335(-)